ncbi:MAG: hypothetical protein IJD32_04350 [Bacteroidaceae bacterium]|nr:hypothetical protein [Bacteroidaceae bacterium]
MNTTEILNYEAPQVEIVEVEVEKGFAASGSGEGFLDDFTNGGSVNQPQ